VLLQILVVFLANTSHNYLEGLLQPFRELIFMYIGQVNAGLLYHHANHKHISSW